MALPDTKTIRIRNKRAGFEYELLEKFNAGIMLYGTEIKSIREGKVNMGDAFCFFRKNDLYIRNLNITEYSKGTHYNHEPMRERKLLLNRKELDKLLAKTKEKGFTIIPVMVYISDRGFAKVEIALARGKKVHDKRDTIRDRDSKREIDRAKKGND